MEVAPPPEFATPGPPSVPLPSDSLGVTVSSLPASFAPPAFAHSSSDTNSSVSSPPHSALSSALSSVPLPPAQYFPPNPLSLLCAGGSSVVCGLLLTSVAVPDIPSVVSHSTPSVSRVVTCPSLFLPPALLPPLLPSHRLLRPPAPPLAPPLLALATDIAHKEEYVCNLTRGGETRWSAAGVSVPRGK